MINYLWGGMIILAVIAGAVTGTMEEVLQSVFDQAQTGVELALGLVGTMAFFTGLMGIMDKAGLTEKLSRVISPILRKLFPEVPEGHKVNGSMALYFACEIMGLGNASTPFGLKTMQELQTLNKTKNIATDAQTMLLAISTTCITLVPSMIIGVRSSLQTEGAAEIIIPVILCTTISTIVGVTANILLGKLDMWNYDKIIEREIAAGTIQVNPDYEGDDPIILDPAQENKEDE